MCASRSIRTGIYSVLAAAAAAAASRNSPARSLPSMWRPTGRTKASAAGSSSHYSSGWWTRAAARRSSGCCATIRGGFFTNASAGARCSARCSRSAAKRSKPPAMPGPTCRDFSPPRPAPTVRPKRKEGLGRLCRQGGRLAAFLPAPAFLERFGDLGRHVFLIVLGEDVRGDKDAVAAQFSFGDDPLPLAEQIRQDAVIDDPQLRLTIAHAERDGMAVHLPGDAVCLDEAADADPPVRRDVLRGQFARAVEKDQVVVKGGEHERRRRAERNETRHNRQQAPPFPGHSRESRGRCAAAKASRLAR